MKGTTTYIYFIILIFLCIVHLKLLKVFVPKINKFLNFFNFKFILQLSKTNTKVDFKKNYFDKQKSHGFKIKNKRCYKLSNFLMAECLFAYHFLFQTNLLKFHIQIAFANFSLNICYD